MKTIRYALLVTLTLILPLSAWAAKPELRGAWVTAWNEGLLTPEQADRTIQAAKDANLNAIFVQVRKTGDAYYDSCFEPRGTNLKDVPDYDPLGYMLKKARKEGLEVHAWAVVYRIWTGKTLAEHPNHVYNVRPEWLSRNSSGGINASDGIWLDPGHLEAREYTIKVLMDVVSKYDVDGLHLDYIRYPGTDWGYNPVAVERFNKATGRTGKPRPDDPAWSDWRRTQITETMGQVYRQATALKPSIKVTAATIAWGDCSADFGESLSYNRTFQDWRAWMRDGILDANMLMNYKDETRATGRNSFRGWVEGACRWRFGKHIYMGLRFNENTAGVTQQILACRNRGTDGIVGFHFNETSWRPQLVRALRNSVFLQKAPVPVMNWKPVSETK